MTEFKLRVQSIFVTFLIYIVHKVQIYIVVGI